MLAVGASDSNLLRKYRNINASFHEKRFSLREGRSYLMVYAMEIRRDKIMDRVLSIQI